MRSPVMACCLMPPADLVHSHDDRSGQAGLLLTLTRSIPYVLSEPHGGTGGAIQLVSSVLQRSRALIPAGETDPEALLALYRNALDGESELPKNSHCR